MSSRAPDASSLHVLSARPFSMKSPWKADGRYSICRSTTMRRALRGMEAELVDLVLEHACPSLWMDWLRVPLECATSTGSLDSVKRLLSAGVDWKAPSHRSSQPGPLLHAAAAGGNEGVVDELVKAGADPNAVDKMRSERTALHVAASEGIESTARALISAGAVVDARDSRGWTPLHVASLFGHRGVVIFLLLKGADALKKTLVEGDTPLHLAASGGHEGVISDLFSFGNACAGCSNVSRETALHVAARAGHVAACITLLRAGAPSGRVNGQGVSPLDVAAVHGHTGPLLDVLVAAENRVDRQRRCSLALYYATKANRPDTMRYLVRLGADVSHRRLGGETCLHLSAARGQNEACVALLEAGADVEARTDDDLTPLHSACMYSRTTTVALLLRWDANESALGSSNRTPFDVVGLSQSTPSEAADVVSAVIRMSLMNAPADRVWRRRSWLVMCRSRWLVREREGVQRKTAGQKARAFSGMPRVYRVAKASIRSRRGKNQAIPRGVSLSCRVSCEDTLRNDDGGQQGALEKRVWKREGSTWSPSTEWRAGSFGEAPREEEGVAVTSATSRREVDGLPAKRQRLRATLRLGPKSMLMDYAGRVVGTHDKDEAEDTRFISAVERLLPLEEEGLFRKIMSYL